MKLLPWFLLPVVCLGGELSDLARSAPAEFAADAMIRIAGLEQTPKAKKIELLQEAFERAGGAQHPYKLKSVVNRPAGAFLNRAYRQDLDALTLQLRAIEGMLALDPAKARELFGQLAPLALTSLSCAQNQAYDLSLLYSVLGRVGQPRQVDLYMATISSPAQVGPAARMLSRIGLGADDFRTAVTAFADALRRVAGDDRSFTASAAAGVDIVALADASRNRGMAPAMLIEAYRAYLVSHLSGERCADSGGNDEAGPAGSVRLFNEKLREPPVKAIEPDQTHPSKSEGTAEAGGGCEDAGCRQVREQYRNLLFNSVGVTYTQAERGKQEWRDQIPALLDALAGWNPEGVAGFAAKCGFYKDLDGMVAVGADREAVMGAMVEFLTRSGMRGEDRMAWFLPLNGLIGSGRMLDLLGNSPDPVIALYAQLEKLAPRTADRVLALL